MAEIQKSNVIVPDLYEEALKGAFAGMKVFNGSPAVIVKPGLPNHVRGGDTVKIPKWSSFGGLVELDEGEEIVPVGIALTSEEASVKRFGAGMTFSAWAQMASIDDPYAEGARQILVGAQNLAEDRLIATAVAAGSDLLVTDISGTGNGKLSYDSLVDTIGAFGDEQTDIVGIAVHSATLSQYRKLKASDGTPLFVDAVNGSAPKFLGHDLLVSDRLTPVDGVYQTVFLRRGALALWYASQPKVEDVRDPKKDEDGIYVNAYFATHRFSRVGGGTKGGVSVLKHR